MKYYSFVARVFKINSVWYKDVKFMIKFLVSSQELRKIWTTYRKIKRTSIKTWQRTIKLFSSTKKMERRLKKREKEASLINQLIVSQSLLILLKMSYTTWIEVSGRTIIRSLIIKVMQVPSITIKLIGRNIKTKLHL